MFGQSDKNNEDRTAVAHDDTSAQSWQPPTTATVEDASEGLLTAHVAPTISPTPSSTPVVQDAQTTGDDSAKDDLIDIKQQALTQLTPLVDHLDQSPEEKFRTTMMMIQASDNQALIKVAYEAAQQINDEKARAQALLDIVNEINYFTQQKDSKL